jgi:CRP-like cAMP-binding protein
MSMESAKGTDDARRWFNQFANLPIFERASGQTLEKLIAAARFAVFEPGRRVVTQDGEGTSFFVLLEGAVRVFQSNRSVEFTSKILRAPIHFADIATLSGTRRYSASIEALTACRVAEISHTVLEEVLDADGPLCKDWLRAVSRAHLDTIQAHSKDVFGGVKARIATILLSYADVFGTPAEGGQRVDFPLSYATLSKQLGCSRRTAIRAMQELEAKGLARLTPEGWLLQCEGLKRLGENSDAAPH